MKKQKTNRNVLEELIRKNYSYKTKFIIFGSPGRKDNSRANTKGFSFLGKGATQFSNLFNKQIKKIKPQLKDLPYDNRELFWVFDIIYNDVRADASIELIFDLLQRNEIITNDVTIRNYHVIAEKIDKEVPHITIHCLILKGE